MATIGFRFFFFFFFCRSFWMSLLLEETNELGRGCIFVIDTTDKEHSVNGRKSFLSKYNFMEY
jgi:hypothetical protein